MTHHTNVAHFCGIRDGEIFLGGGWRIAPFSRLVALGAEYVAGP